MNSLKLSLRDNSDHRARDLSQAFRKNHNYHVHLNHPSEQFNPARPPLPPMSLAETSYPEIDLSTGIDLNKDGNSISRRK